jgi:hypothetical protein
MVNAFSISTCIQSLILARYACCGKEMLGWIREKMATQKSAPRGGTPSRFS